MTVLYIVIGLAVLAALYVIVTYNGLVSLRTRVAEAWSDIDVQMKVRYNLIPNLIETVKGYMGHERETLESVTRLRGEAMANQGEPGAQATSENMLAGALKSLFALAENYPELKADRGFLDLQDQLAEAENKIQAARRYYNGSVRDLNVKIEQFPSNLVARGFAFAQAAFFELDEADAAARQPVQVKF
jgi:LemA protein